MTLVWTPGWNGLTEPEAVSYVAAVEAADGQPLEFATAKAINDFVLGCKNDGIWSAIKASCILSGARTLAGALVPLAGTAPTNFNFVSGDYNRKTGLVGNGSTKYLNSNRNSNADPQDSFHFSCYIVTPHAGSTSAYIANRYVDSSTEFSELQFTSSSSLYVYNRTPLFTASSISGSSVTGLFGSSRTQSSAFNVRSLGATVTRTSTSVPPSASSFTVFARNQSPPILYSNARLAFYSIGESLDLARLDARVTDLINAFAVAIP